MIEFTTPQKKLEEDLEDAQMDIYKKEKDLKVLNKQLDDLSRQKELLEDEIADLRDNEKRIMREIEKAELDLE
jgi:predicted  nucleic acid-binding Zn-ribbon protein